MCPNSSPSPESTVVFRSTSNRIHQFPWGTINNTVNCYLSKSHSGQLNTAKAHTPTRTGPLHSSTNCLHTLYMQLRTTGRMSTHHSTLFKIKLDIVCRQPAAAAAQRPPAPPLTPRTGSLAHLPAEITVPHFCSGLCPTATSLHAFHAITASCYLPRWEI